MFRASFDYQSTSTRKSLEMGFFLKGNRPSARELRFYIAVDVSTFGTDISLKFYLRAALNSELAADHIANNFTMAADAEHTRALDRRGEMP